MAKQLYGESLIKQIVASLMKGYKNQRETFESIQAFQARMEKQVRSDYSTIPHEEFADKYAMHGAKVAEKTQQPISKSKKG